jgi:hypothetical protein
VPAVARDLASLRYSGASQPGQEAPNGPPIPGPSALSHQAWFVQRSQEDPTGERETETATIAATQPEGTIEQGAAGQAGSASRLISRLGFWLGIQRWIRWLFGAVAVGGVWGLVATLLGLGFQHPFFVAGMALYALAFPLGAALCAVVFGRLGQAATAGQAAANVAHTAGVT